MKTAVLKQELITVITWMFIMLVTGVIFDSVFAFLFFGLLVYVLWTWNNLYKLNKWLAHPSKTTPETMGIWSDIYFQLSHLYKRQRKARRKLASILNRFQKSTQALPDATIVLNKSDEIEWFNPAARQIFNLHSGDVGKRITSVIHIPKFASYLIKKDYTNPLKFSVNQKKILLGVTPYGDGQYLISARDITSLSKVEDMQRDFISNASHELRTPLTVISGYIEFLQDSAEKNKLKIPLEKINQQTVRMNRIITELIDLAKLESAAAVDDTKIVDIKMLLNDVYNEALSLDHNKHHIELAIEAEDHNSGPAFNLHGSYEELRMAFSNLMTNAIRYTPEGKAIKLFSSSSNTGISIGVEDEGIGINYKHIPRLTERFYRVDAGRSTQHGGTGLGLAIVKHVLERHNAILRISSEPGKGSTFICEFSQPA